MSTDAVLLAFRLPVAFCRGFLFSLAKPQATITLANMIAHIRENLLEKNDPDGENLFRLVLITFLVDVEHYRLLGETASKATWVCGPQNNPYPRELPWTLQWLNHRGYNLTEKKQRVM